MTIKDLYEWAQDVGATEAQIELQYQDGGGVYEGTTELSEIDLKKDENGKVVIVVLA